MAVGYRLFEGMDLRDAGVAKAVECRNTLVNQVRAHLEIVALSRRNRCVTADDMGPFLATIGKSPADLGNAAGGVFQTPAWEFTGTYTPSTRKTNRARHIRVWRLK